MRELKFRAWDKRQKRWTLVQPGWVMNQQTGTYQLVFYANFDEVEIMQFTGLKDKNAPCQDIYEGDIVQSLLHHFTGVVYFERGAFWVQELFTHVDEGIYDGDRHKETVWSIDLDYEVIGNVYEHPELLDT